MVAVVFRLPDIGEGLTEAEILDWYAEVGDRVKADTPLVAVETDKTQADLPAPVTGTLLHQGAEVGTILEVGALLAVIGEPGDKWASDSEPEPHQDQISRDAGQGAPLATTSKPTALPLVRKLAREAGVDLRDVNGTGPGGRISRADVSAHIAQVLVPQERPPLVGSLDEAAEDLSASPPDLASGTQRRLSPTRRAIASHMERSWMEIPHVTTFASFDAASLLTLKRSLADELDSPVPLEALLVPAVVAVLRDLPEFNASLSNDILTLHDHYHIGIAVDSGDGLLVGVLHDADALSVPDLTAAIPQLVETARARNLSRDQSTGATFTVSNIGAVGGGFGTPIIPYGTTAILSVGRAEESPVVRSGQLSIARVAPLSLSYDHRVIDGALGRAFMERLTGHLEEPTALRDHLT